jgi:hypothetical protein
MGTTLGFFQFEQTCQNAAAQPIIEALEAADQSSDGQLSINPPVVEQKLSFDADVTYFESVFTFLMDAPLTPLTSNELQVTQLHGLKTPVSSAETQSFFSEIAMIYMVNRAMPSNGRSRIVDMLTRRVAILDEMAQMRPRSIHLGRVIFTALSVLSDNAMALRPPLEYSETALLSAMWIRELCVDTFAASDDDGCEDFVAPPQRWQMLSQMLRIGRLRLQIGTRKDIYCRRVLTSHATALLAQCEVDVCVRTGDAASKQLREGDRDFYFDKWRDAKTLVEAARGSGRNATAVAAAAAAKVKEQMIGVAPGEEVDAIAWFQARRSFLFMQ